MEKEQAKELIKETKLWLEPGERLTPPEFGDLRERLKAFLGGERGAQRMECFFDRGTGLLSKTFFYEFVKYLGEKGEKGLGVMLFDLDHLKAYNTYFGDPEGGDKAIVEFVSSFKGATEEVFREAGGYWLVKIDGDTFALLLSEETRDMALRLGQEVEERLLVSQWRPEKGIKKFQTLSLKDQGVLRKVLFPPKVTASSLGFLPVSSLEEFSQGLEGLNEEIRKKKDAKISPEIKKLVARLG